MTRKPRKPAKGLAEPEAAYRHPADDNDVPTDALDAYLWRNRDAINASIRRGREEYARGEYYTAEEVLAEIKARAKKSQARKAKKAGAHRASFFCAGQKTICGISKLGSPNTTARCALRASLNASGKQCTTLPSCPAWDAGA